jgi:hypothetical protein
MVRASDNEFPSVLFDEQASAPTTPATGFWRVYAKSDGLYIVDDAGAETGPFGTGGGGGGGTATDWAVDLTDNANAADVVWDGTKAAGMTTVTVTGSQTITEKTNVLSVSYSGQTADDFNCLLKAHTFSVGDSFAVPVRLYTGNVSVTMLGLIFTDGTTSGANGVTAHLQKHSNEAHTRTYTRHGTLTAMTSISTLHNIVPTPLPWFWLRLTYQATDTFRKELSPDGISWVTAGISDVSKTMTPTHVGVCWTVNGNSGDSIGTFGPILKVA